MRNLLDNFTSMAAALSLAVLLLGLLIRMIASHFQPVHPDGLCHGFKTRILAMELASSPFEVSKILGAHNRRNRAVMRQAQYVDFLFIAAYWLLFLDLSGALALRKFPYAFVVGIAVAVCASAAAYFDVRENLEILKTLKTPLDDSARPSIGICRAAALLKWILIFLAVALLSALFLKWLGLLLLVTGLSGLATVPFVAPPANADPEPTAIPSGFPYGRRVEFATGLLSVTLFTLTVEFVYLTAIGARL
jgi:hypothetical protein